jgi:hypothetical protein
MILKPEIKDKLLSDKKNLIELMHFFEILDSRTIKTAIREDDTKLIRLDCLQVIAKLTDTPVSLLTVDRKKEVA